MKYISLIQALNIPCRLETFGDWHSTTQNWNKLQVMESDGSLWGEYGIEKNKTVPFSNDTYNVANHIRALLDMLYLEQYAVAQGMKKDFVVTDKYNKEIFSKVLMMKDLPYWNKIDRFMTKEYLKEWVTFKKENQHE